MRSAGRGFRRIFALMLAALAAAACAKIVGEDKFVVEALRDVEDAGSCAEGEFQCTGAALQLCREDRSGFRTVQVCSTADLCCDEVSETCARIGCRQPVCAAGDYRCDGVALKLCNDSLTDWITIDSCASPVQCNATLGRCTEAACNPGPLNADYQCNGPLLQQCGTTEWATSDTCESPSLCSAGGTERGCLPSGCLVQGEDGPELSAYDCNNADLRRCNDGQTGFEYVETCINAANCIAHIGKAPDELSPQDLAGLGCSKPFCLAGTYQCDGAVLRRCDSDRLRYRELETCASPSHCNASLGRCEEQPCVAGARQCSANELWLCGADGSWTRERACAPGTRCDVAAQQCVTQACETGDYQCEGSELRRCNVDGSDWIPIHACATAELCNAITKRCERPVCEPNQRRCSRDGRLQVCLPGRNGWQDERNCAAEAVMPVAADAPLASSSCDPAGGCLPTPGCTAGERRCNGEFLERCENNAWHPQERCVTAGLCLASGTGSCRAPACQPGEYRCVVTGSMPPVLAEADSDILGLTLQQCNTGGTGFETVKQCDGQYCDATHGQCDRCDAYETSCDGDVLRRCSADGQEEELDALCSRGCREGLPDAGADSTGQAACIGDPMSATGAL